VLVPLFAAGLLVVHEQRARRKADEERRLANMQQLVAKVESSNVAARRMIMEEQWDDAEAELKMALDLAPANPQSWLYLAWMKLEYYKALPDKAGVKALEEAEAASRRVVDLRPTTPEFLVKALGYQGVALRRLKRFPEAIEALERALAIDPENYALWSNLGTLHMDMRDDAKAEQCLRRGAELAGLGSDNPSYRGRAWCNLTVFELFLQRNEAAKSIERAIEFHEQDALAWVIQARVRLELAEHLNVRKALDDAKYADRMGKSRDPKAKRVLALAHLRNNDFDDAVSEARAAIELKDAPTANHLIIAIAEAKLGQVRAAKDSLAAAESAWPEKLRQSGGFSASAETGELWIESADDLLKLREEAEAAIAGASEKP
jgi:tetratricopeptide (TPR) repeat protein